MHTPVLKPQYYYINVGCKGVFATLTCFRDVCALIGVKNTILALSVSVLGHCLSKHTSYPSMHQKQ